MNFSKNRNANDLSELEKIIFPAAKGTTTNNRKHFKNVRALFLSAFKEAKVGFVKRHLVWTYIARSLKKGISQGKTLYEIEQPLRSFFRKRVDFEKETKPAINERSQKNFCKIKDFILGDRILDLGAGDGLLAKQIASRMKKDVVLVDVVDYNFTKLPLLLYAQDGIIPLGDKSVDTTICYAVLHHSDDPVHVLKEATRVTSKRLILLEGYIEKEGILITNAFIDWYFNRVIRDADINVPFNYAKLDDWREILSSFGFNVIESKYLGIDEPLAPEYHMLIIADRNIN